MIEPNNNVRGHVMAAIQAGRVRMRPRWQFILYSAFGIVGTLLVFFTLIYVASLALFFLRDSGAIFAPSFGVRGWFALLHSLPWLLITLIIMFTLLLEILVRKYSFVYRKPLIVSVLAITALIALCGFAIAQTPFHHNMLMQSRHGGGMPFLGMFYGPQIRPPHEGDVYHGEIVGVFNGGFVLSDIDGEGTTTVYVSPRTRLPYGADFAPGDYVVVVGDGSASGTVQAFGIREIEE
jgi:hypothetical protein